MANQWGKNKPATNLRKHGIDFADAVSAFSDDLAVTTPDERFDEERFITIGLDALGRVLVVAYPWRGQKIRLISTRPATRETIEPYGLTRQEIATKQPPKASLKADKPSDIMKIGVLVGTYA